MAKSAAERKRESRENKLKQSGKKDITFSLDTAVIDNVTSHSKELNINQSDYVNEKLKDAVTSHNSELQKEIDRLNAELAQTNSLYQSSVAAGGDLLRETRDLKALAAIIPNDAETEALKANNFRLAEKSGNLETQLNAAKNDLAQAKLEPARLKAALSEAKRELAKQQRHSCQCLTTKGIQCDKPASHENKVNGFMVWTCEQHYQKAINS